MPASIRMGKMAVNFPIWSNGAYPPCRKRADIIAVDENPLENIRALEDVDFVMKDGTVYKGK